MATTTNVGVDQFVTWDKTEPVVLTAVVTGAASAFSSAYAWSFVSRPAGSSASLVGSTAATVSFTPDKPGAYVVSCAVTDANGNSSDSVTVTVRPTHWVRSSGVKRPATMRAKYPLPSVVSSIVEETV